MPRYIIERTLPKMSPDDMQQLARRSIQVADNIPGVRGVGEKTATTLISNFGTVEALYKVLKKNPEKVLAAGVKEGMITKLLEQEEVALFSKTLAEISCDVPIDFALPKKEW